MLLWYGHPPALLRMSSTRHYTLEQLEQKTSRFMRLGHQVWLSVENELHRVTTQELSFACMLAASYHNQIAYNVPPDDGFQAETRQMEQSAMNHMEAPLSDDDHEQFEFSPFD